ncbi:lytic murein transglycosylase [Sphingomonas sp. ID0503]|uniref:lytic murein transglycosylase n=1 Tax=Sphingomonas sp. ID0503 TaxID=3399691 RepID=UPI003AFA85CA
MRPFRHLIAALCLTAALPAAAQDSGAGFATFVQSLRARAIAEGVKPGTFDSVAPTLTYNPRVVELDRDQPGPSRPGTAIAPFAPYRDKHVDAARIGRGRTKYQQLRPLLSNIERQTGVPESIMVAIWGHETNYGSYTGDFDLLRSLATLAYDGRRRELFTEEFIATLKLLDKGFPRGTLKGSWAGATGYPQFLPSMYLRLGKDGDGDGKADIWTSSADALASIGNYLTNAGWKPNTIWGIPVATPAGLNRDALKPKLLSPRCPRVHERHSHWKTVAEWKALGLTALGRWPAEGELMALIEPDGQGATAYLLSTNYRAILDYNCSNFYALSVGLLADEVSR